MDDTCNRRDLLKWTTATLLGGAFAAGASSADEPPKSKGCVVGQPQAAEVGLRVLAAGGNAVDAAVAAALTAGVVAVRSCGIGGYGGHLVIALAGEKQVTAIDFNTTAPAAARADMYPLDGEGGVKGRVNAHGWLAAGVPGTLAGLQLALDRHGTRTFRELVRPAIDFARKGFEITPAFANATRVLRPQLLADPGSARLLLDRNEPLKAGGTFRNPDLADLLQTLAERGSVESFYKGDIGRRIADAFRKHGGLVTFEDLRTYQARELPPLSLNWGRWSIRTAPLTAGGLSVLEALAILKALDWGKRPAGDAATMRVALEALRIAWHDRLTLLGDPDQVKVPVERLLSEKYAAAMAQRVETALKEGKPVPAQTHKQPAGGTIHLSAADAHGNLVALTLTHGESFGACVTVEGLGLILGHGMLRFDPRPGQANSPGPGKRPLHNMCPTVVLRDGVPVLSVGATGGRRIPNTLFGVLSLFAGRGATLEEAIAAPRKHTEGSLAVTVEAKTPAAEIEHLKKVGYTVKTGPGATVQAVAFDPSSGTCRSASR